MSHIKIETCNRTPNYCALEAVARAIRTNYTQRKSREYQHTQEIKVESGRLLKVTETPMDMDKPTGDAEFKVELA